MSKHLLCGECPHELSYCNNCKVPYCTKCGKEWQEKYTYTSQYPYTWHLNGNNTQIPVAEPATVTCEVGHGNS